MSISYHTFKNKQMALNYGLDIILFNIYQKTLSLLLLTLVTMFSNLFLVNSIFYI